MPHSHRKITRAHVENTEVRNRAVLIYTGWDEYWNTDQYYENNPYLTQEAAEYLRDSQAKLVGIDSHNINDTAGKSRPVHTVLLGAEILIVEHLCNLQERILITQDKDFGELVYHRRQVHQGSCVTGFTPFSCQSGW